MKRLTIAVVDLVTSRPTRGLYSRYMNANLAGIMAQAVAVWWVRRLRTNFICYTGDQDIVRDVGGDVDLVFIGAFTRSAQLAYALSSLFRAQGRRHRARPATRPLLSGRRGACDDYVLGFTDRETIADVLADCAPASRPASISPAGASPASFPSARARWKFITRTLEGAPKSVKVVPMISSLGCPTPAPSVSTPRLPTSR